MEIGEKSWKDKKEIAACRASKIYIKSLRKASFLGEKLRYFTANLFPGKNGESKHIKYLLLFHLLLFSLDWWFLRVRYTRQVWREKAKGKLW